MSLTEKWEEFKSAETSNKRAFYAGAEAGIDTIPIPPEKDFHDVQAEIDRFKGQKSESGK